MHLTDDILCKILSNEKSKPSKITIFKWYIEDGIVDIGDSHTSELSRLHVVYQKKGRIFNRTFILKVPSAHPLYKAGVSHGVYFREYLVYTDILREMYKLDGDRISPRLYYVDNKNSLLLKDLSQSGYKLEDRTKQLGYDHCALVFKGLAKFHALSVKLNLSSKIPSKLFDTMPWFKRVQDPRDIASMMINNACDQFFVNVDPNITQHFVHLKNELKSLGIREICPNNFSFRVLNHGDCWNGNIMFKSDKYGNVKKMKLIDFQNSFWMSPAYDILYFTICSMQFDVYEKYFDLLLDIYITTLNRILAYLQCDLYDIENLKEDMKKIRHFGLLVLMCGLPEFISTYEDPLNFRLLPIDETSYNFDAMNKIFVNESYLEILKKWLTRYIEKGYF